MISRFVNRAFRMNTDDERRAYLARVDSAIAHTDWTLLGYALMSSHIHWAAVAGNCPLEYFTKSLHGGFARWLNRRQGALGPVLAERPTTVVMPPDDCGVLLAYIHNNPVRAGVAAGPAESSWSSHRAFLGLEAAPAWLAVERALALCGFDATAQGRQEFHRFVCARAASPRDPVLSGDVLSATRMRVRASAGAPVEIGTLQLGAGQRPRCSVLAVPGTPIRRRWSGSLEALLAEVANHLDVAIEDMQSKDRRRAVVRARRHALIIGRDYLGRTVAEVGAVLGLSRPAASLLLRSKSPDVAVDATQAQAIYERLCRGESGVE
jgi:GAF domain-containing protein